MKILWLTNVPSPYRVDFFNELGQYCELTVLFERNASSERDESWKVYNTEHFKAVVLYGKSVGVAEAFCPFVIKYLNKNYDYIIVTNFSDPTGWLAIQYMRMRKISYFLESDGGFPKSGVGFKERMKKYFISNANGYFSTSDIHDQYYLFYGAKKDKIWRYPFSSIKEMDIAMSQKLIEKKRVLKQKLNIEEEKVVLTVGRFSYNAGYGKGYDVLLKISELLPSDVGIYIVGEEPTEEFKNWKKERQLRHVHFVGFKIKEELLEYYACADVFAFLSRGEAWGLVINEAMSFGLPIIATKNCVAATELVDKDNGFIVEHEDVQGIADKVMRILYSDEERKRLGEVSLRKIKDYTIENMARTHVNLFHKLYKCEQEN